MSPCETGRMAALRPVVRMFQIPRPCGRAKDRAGRGRDQLRGAVRGDQIRRAKGLPHVAVARGLVVQVAESVVERLVRHTSLPVVLSSATVNWSSSMPSKVRMIRFPQKHRRRTRPAEMAAFDVAPLPDDLAVRGIDPRGAVGAAVNISASASSTHEGAA